MKTPVEKLADLLEESSGETLYGMALAILNAGYTLPAPTCLVCGADKHRAKYINCEGGRHTWKQKSS